MGGSPLPKPGPVDPLASNGTNEAPGGDRVDQAKIVRRKGERPAITASILAEVANHLGWVGPDECWQFGARSNERVILRRKQRRKRQERTWVQELALIGPRVSDDDDGSGLLIGGRRDSRRRGWINPKVLYPITKPCNETLERRDHP